MDSAAACLCYANIKSKGHMILKKITELLKNFFFLTLSLNSFMIIPCLQSQWNSRTSWLLGFNQNISDGSLTGLISPAVKEDAWLCWVITLPRPAGQCISPPVYLGDRSPHIPLCVYVLYAIWPLIGETSLTWPKTTKLEKTWLNRKLVINLPLPVSWGLTSGHSASSLALTSAPI